MFMASGIFPMRKGTQCEEEIKIWQWEWEEWVVKAHLCNSMETLTETEGFTPSLVSTNLIWRRLYSSYGAQKRNLLLHNEESLLPNNELEELHLLYLDHQLGTLHRESVLGWSLQSEFPSSNKQGVVYPWNEVNPLLTRRCPYEMQKQFSQVFRFFMPMFLHANFLHILWNSLFALIFGSMLESVVGPLKMFAIWIVGGFGGILFSATCSNSPAVGASTSLMAILGAFIGWLVVNWKALAQLPMVRCMLTFILVFISFIQVVFGFATNSNADNFGHLGGWLTGFAFGMMIVNVIANQTNRANLPGFNYEKITKFVGIGGTLIFFLVNFLIFFLSREPVNSCGGYH